MASRLHFCLHWPRLLLVVLRESPHGNPHSTDSGNEDGLGEVSNAVAPGSSHTGSSCYLIRTSLASGVRWTGRCCLYPLGGSYYNVPDVARYFLA